MPASRDRARRLGACRTRIPQCLAAHEAAGTIPTSNRFMFYDRSRTAGRDEQGHDRGATSRLDIPHRRAHLPARTRARPLGRHHRLDAPPGEAGDARPRFTTTCSRPSLGVYRSVAGHEADRHYRGAHGGRRPPAARRARVSGPGRGAHRAVHGVSDDGGDPDAARLAGRRPSAPPALHRGLRPVGQHD